MDVSPIQRLAITANHAARPVEAPREPAAVSPPAQAAAARADQQADQRSAAAEVSTQVVVAWHPASLGYVTRIVDQQTGDVVLQTPPQQVLDMVQKILDRLERVSR